MKLKEKVIEFPNYMKDKLEYVKNTNLEILYQSGKLITIPLTNIELIVPHIIIFKGKVEELKLLYYGDYEEKIKSLGKSFGDLISSINDHNYFSEKRTLFETLASKRNNLQEKKRKAQEDSTQFVNDLYKNQEDLEKESNKIFIFKSKDKIEQLTLAIQKQKQAQEDIKSIEEQLNPIVSKIEEINKDTRYIEIFNRVSNVGYSQDTYILRSKKNVIKVVSDIKNSDIGKITSDVSEESSIAEIEEKQKIVNDIIKNLEIIKNNIQKPEVSRYVESNFSFLKRDSQNSTSVDEKLKEVNEIYSNDDNNQTVSEEEILENFKK